MDTSTDISPDVFPLYPVIDQLNERAQALYRSNPVQSIELSLTSQKLAKGRRKKVPNYPRGLIQSKINQANAMTVLGHHELGLQLAQNAVTIATELELPDMIGWGLAACGLASGRMCDYSQAIKYFYDQLNHSRQVGDLSCEAEAHARLGAAYGESGRIEDALHHCREALDLYRSGDDLVGQIKSLNNLCMAHGVLDQPEQALSYALEALRLWDDAKISQRKEVLLLTVGTTYLKLGDKENALAYFDQIRSIINLQTDSLELADLFLNLGKLYFSAGNTAEGRTQLARGLEMAERLGNTRKLYQMHETLADHYKSLGKFEEALHHFEVYQSLKESVHGDEYLQKINEIKASYLLMVEKQERQFFEEKSQLLEERVRERTNELEIMALQLQHAYQNEAELNKLRSRIITTVSHEFRTPLAIINNSTYLLSQSVSRLSDDKREEIYGRVQDSVDYLTALIHDVALVDSLHHKVLRPNRVERPFGVMVQRVVEEWGDQVASPERLKVEFDRKSTEPVAIDLEILYEIGVHLLTNALKFSEDVIKVSIVCMSSGGLALTVRDLGIGISQFDQSRVCEIFYRGQNIGERRGLGLGLYIVDTLLQKVNGTLTIESELKSGTTCTVYIPASEIEFVGTHPKNRPIS